MLFNGKVFDLCIPWVSNSLNSEISPLPLELYATKYRFHSYVSTEKHPQLGASLPALLEDQNTLGCVSPTLPYRHCTILPQFLGTTVPLRCQLPFLRLWASLCLHPCFVYSSALAVLPSSTAAPSFSSTEYNSKLSQNINVKMLCLQEDSISMMYGCSVPWAVWGRNKNFCIAVTQYGIVIYFRISKSY